MKNHHSLLLATSWVFLMCLSTQLSADTITASCSSKGGSFCTKNIGSSGLHFSIFQLSAQDCPGIITDVDVTVNILHTSISFLQLTLQHDGVSTILFDHDCGTQDDIIGTFDDQATSGNVCNISSGTDVQPIGQLSGHNGSGVDGSWTLRIDSILSATGSLNDWSITVTCEVPPPLPEISIEEGFIKLHTTNGSAPLDYYCSTPEGYGRMVFDETIDVLYICSNAGWVIH